MPTFHNTTRDSKAVLCHNGGSVFHYSRTEPGQYTTTGQTTIEKFARGQETALIARAEAIDTTPGRQASGRLRDLIAPLL